MQRNLTTDDLNLYSRCPQLYKYYLDNDLNTNDFRDPLHTVMQNACAWIFSTVIRVGRYPTVQRLDAMWSRRAPSGLEEKVKNNIWIILRKVLSKTTSSLIPVQTNVPIRHITPDGVAVNTFCPLIAEESSKLTAVFFKIGKTYLYKNDYQIRLCTYKLSSLLGIDYILIYNIDPSSTKLSRYNMYPENFDTHKFITNFNQLALTVAQGPYHPVFECHKRSECKNWATCIV